MECLLKYFICDGGLLQFRLLLNEQPKNGIIQQGQENKCVCVCARVCVVCVGGGGGVSHLVKTIATTPPVPAGFSRASE